MDALATLNWVARPREQCARGALRDGIAWLLRRGGLHGFLVLAVAFRPSLFHVVLGGELRDELGGPTP